MFYIDFHNKFIKFWINLLFQLFFILLDLFLFSLNIYIYIYNRPCIIHITYYFCFYIFYLEGSVWKDKYDRFDLPELGHLVYVSQILPVDHYSSFIWEHLDLIFCILRSTKYILTTTLLESHILYSPTHRKHITYYNPYLLPYLLFFYTSSFIFLLLIYSFIHSRWLGH